MTQIFSRWEFWVVWWGFLGPSVSNNDDDNDDNSSINKGGVDDGDDDDDNDYGDGDDDDNGEDGDYHYINLYSACKSRKTEVNNDNCDHCKITIRI